MFGIFDFLGLVLQAHQHIHIPPQYILYGSKNQYVTLPGANDSSQHTQWRSAFFLPPTVCAWVLASTKNRCVHILSIITFGKQRLRQIFF